MKIIVAYYGSPRIYNLKYLRLKWRAGGPRFCGYEREKKGGKLPLRAKSLRKLYALIEKIRYVEYGE
jgi:hypothetical protein